MNIDKQIYPLNCVKHLGFLKKIVFSWTQFCLKIGTNYCQLYETTDIICLQFPMN